VGFVDHFRQLIATHRSIPFKEGGKPSGISDCNQYAIQNKLVRLSRKWVLVIMLSYRKGTIFFNVLLKLDYAGN